MRVNFISNYNLGSLNQKQELNNPKNNIQTQEMPTFTGDDKKASRALRNTVIGAMMLPVAGGLVASCDTGDAEAWTKIDINWTEDSTHVAPKDTTDKWRDNFVRPIPLDSLYKNIGGWGFGDGDINDSTSNRNIVHYEGTREWEYMTREIADINLTDFPNNKNVLVYDTEIQDYKGNTKSYGKQVLRIPEGNFTVTTKDGEVLNSPKGFFVESWVNNLGVKGASIYDCDKVSSAFCQTNGEVLNVAKVDDTGNHYVQTGSVQKGYLGDNSILLRDLIGIYSTDDHYTGFEIKAVNDSVLKDIFVDQMKDKYAF